MIDRSGCTCDVICDWTSRAALQCALDICCCICCRARLEHARRATRSRLYSVHDIYNMTTVGAALAQGTAGAPCATGPLRHCTRSRGLHASDVGR